MISLKRDTIKSYLRKHTISGYWFIAATAGSLILVGLITALPLYIIAQTCGVTWFWLTSIALCLYLIISYLISDYRSLKTYFHDFVILSIPLGIRIIFSTLLMYMGMGLIMRLLLGAKFTDLLYQEQLANQPKVPLLEPLVLKISNLVQQHTALSSTSDIEEALAQKTVEQFLCYIHQGLTFLLIALSIVPALWFYLWIRKELLTVHTKQKTGRIS